jgi:hypothetical protein
VLAARRVINNFLGATIACIDYDAHFFTLLTVAQRVGSRHVAYLARGLDVPPALQLRNVIRKIMASAATVSPPLPPAPLSAPPDEKALQGNGAAAPADVFPADGSPVAPPFAAADRQAEIRVEGEEAAAAVSEVAAPQSNAPARRTAPPPPPPRPAASGARGTGAAATTPSRPSSLPQAAHAELGDAAHVEASVAAGASAAADKGEASAGFSVRAVLAAAAGAAAIATATAGSSTA